MGLAEAPVAHRTCRSECPLRKDVSTLEWIIRDRPGESRRWVNSDIGLLTVKVTPTLRLLRPAGQ